jgi:hypothetical protein
MRLVTYDRGGARRLAAWVGDRVVDLPDAVGHPAFPATLEALVARSGGSTMDAARAALEYPGAIDDFSVRRATLLAPLTLGGTRTAPLLGPGQAVGWDCPPDARLVCRPQLACVVGRPGTNLEEREALTVVFGYTLVNEWIAASPDRDDERLATSVGPCVVTIDDFDPSRRVLLVRVDGRRVAATTVGVAVARAFARSLVRTSRVRAVQPGEIYGLRPLRRPLEVRIPQRRRRGRDPVVVSVEVPGIGSLETPVSR